MTVSYRARRLAAGLLWACVAGTGAALIAQSPIQSCNATPAPAWCSAVPGDRSEGWAPQRRSEVMARNGMVATSQPLAAQAGLDILKKGGNAIDAAVATAAVLSVVEPMNVGPAGDLFAIIYIARENKLYTLNASGKAPTGADARAHERARLLAGTRRTGGPDPGCRRAASSTVTVPGAVWGWDEVQHRFGTLTFKETLQPAIDYAEQGFPVSERIAQRLEAAEGARADAGRSARLLHAARSRCGRHVVRERPAARRRADLPQSRPGEDVPDPAAARPRRLLQGRDRPRASSTSRRPLGGTMTLDDLASYSGEWITPATTNYHGYDVFTLPPPAQTWATDEILNILDACVPQWAPGQTLASARPRQPEVLAPRRRGQEAGVHRPVRLQRRSELRAGAARSAAVEGARAVAVQRGRSRSRVRHGVGRRASRAAATRSCSRRPIASATWSRG